MNSRKREMLGSSGLLTVAYRWWGLLELMKGPVIRD